MKTMVVIPAHNEQKTVGDIVAAIVATTDYEIVVVDDASTDQTADNARKAGATVLSLALRLGAWGAVQTGIRYALKQESDIVITMDGDGQHTPHDFPTLLQNFSSQKSDVVIGCDLTRGSWQRHIAWNFYRVITGLNIQDLTSGFRLYGKKALPLLASNQATLLDYQDIGVLLLLQKNDLTISEVDIQIQNRMHGHSHIFFSWFAVLKYLTHSILLSFSRRNHGRIPFKRV